MTRKRLLIILLILSFFACTTGCGNQVKVKGRVTFAEDGSPLTTGTVCFETTGHTARGFLDKNGCYQLTSIKENDGVPPGNYKVFIEGALEPAGNDKLGMAVKVAIVDRKYTDPTNPAYTFEVNSSNKVFDFTIERIKKK